MKDSRNITIMLLLATGAILTAMLLATHFEAVEPAVADTSVKDGDYVLCTGAWSDKRDLLYVIDIAAKQLNVYAVNPNKSTIEQLDTVNLDRAFGRP